MSIFLLAQIIGASGVMVSLFIFQTNKRSRMLQLGMFASVFYTVQFILLGAFTGAALNVVGAARNYAYFKVKPSKRYQWVMVTFIIIGVLATAVTWHGPVSLLALAGSSCGSFAGWHKKPKYIRRWALLAPPMWFTYSYLTGSYPGMLLEVIMLSSNLVGEYRLDFKHATHIRRRMARPA